jgi:hypothetical protein
VERKAKASRHCGIPPCAGWVFEQETFDSKFLDYLTFNVLQLYSDPMAHSSSPLGNLLLAACSSRRVPAIAAVLVIPDIRIVPAASASSIAGCIRRRTGGGGRGC